MSLIDVRNVHKTYDNGVEILRNVNFSIERKECLGLVGESGCGKSTLARIILQIESIDRGRSYLKEPRCKIKVNAV